MGRKIVVTSGKGGVGKTSITAHLGYFLCNAGYSVAMVDGDMGLNNLDVVLGVENRVIYDIVDVIDGRCSIRQSLIKVKDCDNLFVLPSAHSYEKSKVTGQNLKIVTKRLSEIFDFVLVDCPAGVELGFHRAVSAVDEAIVVTTPSISSIRDGSKVISMLNTYDVDIVGLVVNMARGDLIVSGHMMGIEEISELLALQVIGVIPDSDHIEVSTSMGNSIDCASNIFKAFELLARNITCNDNKLFDCTSAFKGVFGKIRRDLKRRV